MPLRAGCRAARRPLGGHSSNTAPVARATTTPKTNNDTNNNTTNHKRAKATAIRCCCELPIAPVLSGGTTF